MGTLDKQTQISQFLSIHRPHLCVITETWLSKAKKPPAFTDYYVAARCDREDTKDGRGGGTMILCHKSFRVKKRDIATSVKSSQICAVEYKDLLIAGFYHSPTSTKSNELDELFYDELCEIHDSNVIFLGDANSAASFKDSSKSTNLRAFMNNFGLHQMVEGPTHDKGNTLDVVLCSDPRLVKGKPEVIPTTMSDHHFIVTEFKIPTAPMEVPITITRPSMLNYADIEQEVAFYLSVLPDDIVSNEMAEEYSEHFHDTISSVFKRHLEKTKITTVSRPNEPYITPEIIRLRKANVKLLGKAKKANTAEMWQTYNTHYDNMCTLVQKEQAKYELRLVQSLKSKPHKFYKYAEGKTKSCAPIGPLMNEGQQIGQDQAMADVLAKHYEGAHSDFIQYEGQYLNPLGTPVMPDVHITERKVRKALFTLKPNKAPGGDNITIVQLRKLQRTVVPYLTKIIKYSYETGYIYTHWHKVLIAPLHKPGKPRDQASSYRPVALLMGTLKLAEYVIMVEWVKHMEKAGLMSGAQHAGRRGRSTITNMVEYMDFLTKAIDEGHSCTSLAFDMSLAFDKSTYKDIIDSVLEHGMAPKGAKWLDNFLTNRKISVKVGECVSKPYTPNSSTSQGSVSGVAYFNCIMDGLKHFVGLNYFQFCDDTKIIAITDTNEQKNELQRTVDNFAQWTKNRHLKVNPTKSVAMYFNKAEARTYTFDGLAIPRSKESVDLGAVVDEKVTWRPHIEAAIATLKQKSQMARRNFKSRSGKVMKLLWEVFCTSSFQYMTPIIPITSKMHQRQIMRIQKNFFRNVLFDERCEGPAPLLHQLERLRLCFVWKVMHKQTCLDPDSLFQIQHKGHRLGPMRLSMPKCRTRARREFFAANVVEAWNELPANKKVDPSINRFKTYLKKKHYSTKTNEHLSNVERFKFENVAAA